MRKRGDLERGLGMVELGLGLGMGLGKRVEETVSMVRSRVNRRRK